jgi:hypothetical protein
MLRCVPLAHAVHSWELADLHISGVRTDECLRTDQCALPCTQDITVFLHRIVLLLRCMGLASHPFSGVFLCRLGTTGWGPPALVSYLGGQGSPSTRSPTLYEVYDTACGWRTVQRLHIRCPFSGTPTVLRGHSTVLCRSSSTTFGHWSLYWGALAQCL